MIDQVAVVVVFHVKPLFGACILIFNLVDTVQPPEAGDRGFKQLVVGGCCALILQVFDEILLAYLLASDAVQILNVEQGLVELLDNIVFKATARTDVGMVFGFVLVFEVSVSCEVLAWNPDFLPDAIDESLPVLRDFPTDGIDELGIVHKSGTLLIEYFEDHASFGFSDVYALLLDNLLEFVDADHHVTIDIGRSECLFEYEIAADVPRC